MRSLSVFPEIMNARILAELCSGISPTAHSAPRLSPALRAPPLCRCAERTVDLILRSGRSAGVGALNAEYQEPSVVAAQPVGGDFCGAERRVRGQVLLCDIAKQDLTPRRCVAWSALALALALPRVAAGAARVTPQRAPTQSAGVSGGCTGQLEAVAHAAESRAPATGVAPAPWCAATASARGCKRHGADARRAGPGSGTAPAATRKGCTAPAEFRTSATGRKRTADKHPPDHACNSRATLRGT